MGIVRWIKGMFGRAGGGPSADEPWTLRRFESAETTRLNQSRWSTANGAPINEDLAESLETARARAAYEAINNPTIEGVINTYVTDVVGKHGPTLQIKSSDTAYAAKREAVWRTWWKRPCTNRKLSGGGRLRQWIRSYWICGESFDQLVSKPTYAGAVKLRLLPIHPRRVGTPMTSAGDGQIVLGVQFTEDGDPVAYHVQKYTRFGAYQLTAGETQKVPAALMIHGFLPVEEDQARGIPWLNSALGAAAELRDYDASVLNASHNAARQATWLYTDREDAPFVKVNATEEIEEGDFISTCPPGYKPMGLQPSQPQAVYIDYRGERQRDIGRPVGMPLMMVRLDSSGHNYSSARFDGQSYARQIGFFQGHLEGVALDPLEEAVAREAELAGELPPPPQDMSKQWSWPPLPHVDPKKEVEAITARMENRTLTWSEAVIAEDKDPDEVLKQHERDRERFEKAQIPFPPSLALAKAPGTPPGEQKDDGWNNSDKPKQKTGGSGGQPATKSNGSLLHA